MWTLASVAVLLYLLVGLDGARYYRKEVHHNRIESNVTRVTLNQTMPNYDLDDLNCLEYYPEQNFKEAVETANLANDPCLTCADIVMFEQDDFISPATLPEEVCLAGYRAKYCEFGTYICFDVAGSGIQQPSFCAAAVASGKGNVTNGYKVEGVCHRKSERHVEADHSAEDVARHKEEMHRLLEDGKLEDLLLTTSTKNGLDCLRNQDELGCDVDPEGCIYHESLRTEDDSLDTLATALGFGSDDTHLLDLHFSWNTGCVPRQIDTPSARDNSARDNSASKLQWKDDTCFLNSALFALFAQHDEMIPRLATPAGGEEDGCGEFVRSGVRNVVARMRTAHTVRYDEWVGLLRKGLPLACPEFMSFQAMQEIATSGKGNYRAATTILLMAMGFDITEAELRKGVEAYRDHHGAPEAVKLSYKADFSLRSIDVQLSVGKHHLVHAGEGPDAAVFHEQVYGSVLVIDPAIQGLRAMYGIMMEPSLKSGACKDSFSACIVDAFMRQGHSLIFPPRFLMLSVDLSSEQRKEVASKNFMPKDFGTAFALPPEILEGCGSCKTPTYSLRSFGAANEIHQTAFARSGSLKSAWVYHNDMGGKYVWATETEISDDQAYDVKVSEGLVGLRQSSTTLFYQIDVAAWSH